MERIQPHLWWTAPALVIAVALGLTFDSPLGWLAYATLNVAGVWLYAESHQGSRSAQWMKALAIVLLPVGVIGVLASKGASFTPAEAISIGSDDASVRRESSRSQALFNRGSF